MGEINENNEDGGSGRKITGMSSVSVEGMKMRWYEQCGANFVKNYDLWIG